MIDHQILKKHVEERLLFWISKTTSYPLFESSKYAVESGGKRIRPILFLSLCHDEGVNWKSALDIAAAIECIHIYSLIHDDLPSMDNDDKRRGLPTLHKKFDEATAILSGDYFLTLSFQIISYTSIPAKKKEKILQLLSVRSGAKGMIGGQVLDLQAEKEQPSSLLHIHRKKTGALLSASLEAAAIFSDLSSLYLLQMRKLGLSFGICYQLLDDKKDIDDDAWNNSYLLMGEEKTSYLIERYKKRIRRYSKFLPQNGMVQKALSLFLQTKITPGV